MSVFPICTIQKSVTSYLNARLVPILLLIGLVAFSLCGCGGSGLNPGEFAPDFSSKSLNGENVRLSDYKGQVVLLNFWASWCQSCLEEMPGMQSLYAGMKEKGFVIVAVSSKDSVEGARAMAERLKLTFPILMDPDGSIAAKYKTTGFPESFLIDGNGRLVMFSDPGDSAQTARIVGPRKWETPVVQKELLGLISEIKR